jgi:hypothetical protein
MQPHLMRQNGEFSHRLRPMIMPGRWRWLSRAGILAWDGHPRRDRHGRPLMVVRAGGR